MSLELSLNPITIKVTWIDRLRGLFALVIAYSALNFLSLSRICKILGILKPRCSREMTTEEADIAWGAVRKTSFFFFGRAACIELSLAFIVFALTKGLSATWCVGVATEPFQSHAWVEIDGQPFRENDYFKRHFQKVLES